MDSPLDNSAASPLYLSTREGYDLWANVYDAESNPLVVMEEPQMKFQLGDVRGLSILDVGCGTGRHAIPLAAQGAKVTAIDFSKGMLARAQTKPSAESIRFIQHDIAAPFPFDNASFDRVICGLVFDHVANPTALFREMGRVCSVKGAIVASIMHPAMMLRGVQARFQDPNTGRDTRPESFPHQISDYVMAALNAGLRLIQVSEHIMDAKTAAKCPRGERYIGWPILLMITARLA